MMSKNLKWYHEEIKDSKLEVLCEEEKIKAYYLRKYPDRRTMSTLLIFTPEGIVITGDLRPVRTGCMTYGYTLEWFVSQLAPGYLAEKFLETKWSVDCAKDFLKNKIAELKEDEEFGKAKEAETALERGFCFDSEHAFYEVLQGFLDFDGFSYDYLEPEIGWLSAIQKKFAEEWHKRQEATKQKANDNT